MLWQDSVFSETLENKTERRKGLALKVVDPSDKKRQSKS